MHIAIFYSVKINNNESLQRNDSIIVFELFYNNNNNINLLHYIYYNLSFLGNKLLFLLSKT